MTKTILVSVELCESSVDAYGLINTPLAEGAREQSRAELTNLVDDSDNLLTF